MRKRDILFIALLTIISLTLESCKRQPGAGESVLVEDGFKPGQIDGYWIYLPEKSEPSKRRPVLVYLHGGNAVSTNPRDARDEGPFLHREKVDLVKDSFIVINPHLRAGSQTEWYDHSEQIKSIIDGVIREFSGDPDRIYLTGASKGGHGAWGLAKRDPRNYAALATIAGRINCSTPCEPLEEMPMWIIHNESDPSVSSDYAKSTLDILENDLGWKFQRKSAIDEAPRSKRIVSIFPAEGHDAWTNSYAQPALYRWMLDQSASD